jgi:ubiquinone/menaquinone biosynthesis C-methylase UbiE
MSPAPADWQLPAGVNRGLWGYIHNAELARRYDTDLQNSSLPRIDLEFVQQHCRPPGRLIDLGCGTGRALLPLSQAGFWVVGVDLSEEMLRLASARAEKVNATVQLLQANLVELDAIREQTFDHAICLFSTLGMISGAGNRERVLGHVYRLLRPGGCFILHVHNKWFSFWDRHGRYWLLHDCWRTLMRSHVRGDRGMPLQDSQAGLTLHHFTRREIVSMLRRAGFWLVEVRSVSLRSDGVVTCPWCFGWLRTYGYLIAAVKGGPFCLGRSRASR